MKNSVIAPSMMCVDYGKMTETLKTFEKNSIGYLHIDVMDGEFVPNYALGTDFCRKMHEMTSIPLDVHLMVNRPDLKLDFFDIREGDYFSFHYEATPHVQRTLCQIKDRGAKAMIALCPSTPADVIKYIEDVIDGVLIMTVNPGFAGQKLIPATLEKIKEVRQFLDSRGRYEVDVEVDGNVSFENAVKMRSLGANIFVGGSSSVFSKDSETGDNIIKMNRLLK